MLEGALVAEPGSTGATLRDERGEALQVGPRGKRRLHAKPRLSEILACRPWLGLELATVRPRVIVCLGLTAARAVLGRPVVIGKLRGQPLSTESGTVFVTSHPSAILRAPDAASRARGRTQLVADLAQAAKAAAAKP